MRLYFLDNLKLALIVLVVVHHAGQAYGPTDYWPVTSDEQLPLLAAFFNINGAFFMGLFFMISACFLPQAFDRRGSAALIRERLLRLGIPLLFMTVVVFGPITYLVDEIQGSFWRYMLFDYLGSGDLEIAHLWFLSVLLFMSLCYVAFRQFSILTGGAEPVVQTEPPSHLTLLLFTAALAAANMLVRQSFPVGVWVEVVPFMPVEVGRLPQYAGFFVVGLMASRYGWLRTMPLTTVVPWACIGAAAAVLHVLDVMLGRDPTLYWPLQEALIGVGFCISLPVLAREFCNWSGSVLTSLASLAFTVYLLHIIIIYVLQEAMESFDASALVKFTLVAVLGILLSFTAGWGFQRLQRIKS